jgi:2-C-methyl-D-erythritol 4-phosphate cytidylyltransferase
MVVHTLRAFAPLPQIARVLLVVAPDDTRMAEVLHTHDVAQGLSHDQPRFELAPVGGATRADSVLAGLQHLIATGADRDDWVLVHDAARCLITPAQIEALINACQSDDVGGLLALPLADTLKASQAGRVTQTVSRDDKWQAQTPQMFRLGALKQALVQAQAQGWGDITDEASAIERQGLSPRLVPASAQNFKVTYPEDFFLAEAVLAARQRRTMS